MDWEVELCIVIGEKASRVKADDALSYVMGCTIAQDISARDWQKDKNSGQFLLGKVRRNLFYGSTYYVLREVPKTKARNTRRRHVKLNALYLY